MLERIKKRLPPHEMVDNFGLARKSMISKLGNRVHFTSEDKIALMFLKNIHRTE